LGSTHAVTAVTDTIKETTDHYPFGAIRFDTTNGHNERKKFTGYEYDADTQLSYAGARYQDGRVGRFVSQDPAFLAVGDANRLKEITKLEIGKYLEDPQGLNSYNYSRNNPLSFIDPNGEWYKEFFTGNQSWDDFQGELGMAADQLSQDSRVWNAAISHPEVPAIIGGGALLAAGGVYVYGIYQTAATLSGAAPVISNYLNSTQDITSRLSNLANLPVVQSAVPKLNLVAEKCSTSCGDILNRASETTMRLVDMSSKNYGNINLYFPKPGSEGFVRVTTDPAAQRIISAGFNQLKDVVNGLASGRFIPYE
jgi:RHS repeat-associated protein